jgi:hypothetical protein
LRFYAVEEGIALGEGGSVVFEPAKAALIIVANYRGILRPSQITFAQDIVDAKRKEIVCPLSPRLFQDGYPPTGS